MVTKNTKLWIHWIILVLALMYIAPIVKSPISFLGTVGTFISMLLVLAGTDYVIEKILGI